ncbi:MAG: glycosyltransferase family 39 protein [Acidobacteria bacterium]|nr:glycosyltransferase family 39 protein [Acidobacteriota bacterium]
MSKNNLMDPNRQNRTAWLVLLIFTAVFFIRLYFRQISFWDWDELLYASAIHNYDLFNNSPHPIGYPLWVCLIRISYKLFGNEVDAQVLMSVLFGSLAVFPLYDIFRQAASAKIAIGGLLVYLFNPVVWTTGETGYNDPTAFFVFAMALAFLLRSKDNRYFYLGSFLLGLGLGVRPPNLALGVFFLVPLWGKLRARDFWAALTGITILGVTCLAWLIPMAIYGAGGLKEYADLITTYTDEIKEADRWGLTMQTFMEFRLGGWVLRELFLTIWGTPFLAAICYLLSAVGLLSYITKKKWRELLIVLGCFFPFLIFAFLFNSLDYMKYTIPYIPLFAFFTAVGVNELSSRLGHLRNPAFLTGMTLLLITESVQALPLVSIFREQKAPVVQAIEYIQKNISPQNVTIFYDKQYFPFVRQYLKNYTSQSLIPSAGEHTLPQPGMNAVILSHHYPELNYTWALGFSRESEAFRLLGIARSTASHYQTVWISTADIAFLDFDRGYFRTFLWTGNKSYCFLKNKNSSDKMLTIKAFVPIEQLKQPPLISLYLDGRLLAEFRQETHTFIKTFLIPGQDLEVDAWSSLEINTDQTFDPAGTPYENEENGKLGFSLEQLIWAAADRDATTRQGLENRPAPE